MGDFNIEVKSGKAVLTRKTEEDPKKARKSAEATADQQASKAAQTDQKGAEKK